MFVNVLSLRLIDQKKYIRQEWKFVNAFTKIRKITKKKITSEFYWSQQRINQNKNKVNYRKIIYLSKKNMIQ